MTLTTPARRRLFPTPASSAKRRKTMTQTRIPKAMMPELKQFVSTAALTSVTDSAYVSIPSIMNPGTGGDDFEGSKFRIMRVRVYYDYSDVATTSGIRMALGMPKISTATTILDTSSVNGTVRPANARSTTILKEKFLKTDGSDLNGYMEWTGPLNVEMNGPGNGIFKNNLIFQVNSDGVGTSLAASSRTAIEVLFTG